MFGVFKGLNIKGVLFRQGYSNATAANCRPKRYRVLLKLMGEGRREDFSDPTLPVGIIGFCAGSVAQRPGNFEHWTGAPGAYIRESQRLGLTDLEDPSDTAFLPAHDVQIPGLHPHKKRAHGVRAARWALGKIYGLRVNWQKAAFLSAEPEGGRMVLTFDTPCFPTAVPLAALRPTLRVVEIAEGLLVGEGERTLSELARPVALQAPTLVLGQEVRRCQKTRLAVAFLEHGVRLPRAPPTPYTTSGSAMQEVLANESTLPSPRPLAVGVPGSRLPGKAG